MSERIGLDRLHDDTHLVRPRCCFTHLDAWASALFTDSIEQLRAYPLPSFLSGTPHMDRITDLAGHVAGEEPIRCSADDVTLFLSVGLSGTEVVVADIALSKRR